MPEMHVGDRIAFRKSGSFWSGGVESEALVWRATIWGRQQTRLSGALAVLAITAVSAAGATAAQNFTFRSITLRDPRLIAEAESVNAAIHDVMGVAESCHAQSAAAALTCGCGAKGSLDRLRLVYRRVAGEHPVWAQPDVIVSYVNPVNGHWISLNLAAANDILSHCALK